MFRERFTHGLIILVVGAGLGYWTSHLKARSSPANFLASAQAAENPADTSKPASSLHLRQSPAAVATGREETDYGLGESYYKKLQPYPQAGPGERTPLDLWRYAGRGDNSW